MNTTVPARKIRRRPSRSAARPPSRRKPPKTSAYALMTHCRFCSENPRSTWIEGSATFTTAMSRTTMNWTALRRASASHFLRFELIMEFIPSQETCCLSTLPGGAEAAEGADPVNGGAVNRT